ncbi:MAG: Hsp20/alpha crystallin family protein [Thermomicrobiaceae bacterium]
MSMSPRIGKQDLESMRDRLDRLLSDIGGRTWEMLERSMPVDVYESETSVIVTSSVPGIEIDNIDIQVVDNVLTIRANVPERSETTEGTWHIQERRTGVIERSIPIPRSADIDRADASLENGVLTITFPVEEQAQRRRIQIRSGSGSGPQH